MIQLSDFIDVRNFAFSPKNCVALKNERRWKRKTTFLDR
jgi:hypothetical protein